MAGGDAYQVGGDAAIEVPRDGAAKLVEEVEQISFSAERALRTGQRVTYVTERAVFELTPSGLELTEVAPGLDVLGDVVSHMEFKPSLASDVREIDSRIYRTQKLGLQLGSRVSHR